MAAQHDVVARLAGLPTAAISDALDQAGIEGAVHGLAPLSDGFRAVGPAFTVRYAPIGDTVGGTVGDFLDDVPRVRSSSSTTTAALTSRCGAAS